MKHVYAMGAAAVSLLGPASGVQAQTFTPGSLVVSRSVYQDVGTVATLQVGSNLPDSKDGTAATTYKAVADGTYPNVFNNAPVDGSFGVTSPIFLDQLALTPGGLGASYVNSYAIPTSQLVTSFSSKSELGLNLSTNGTALTFIGYTTSVGNLDVSNTPTPGSTETGNYVTTAPTYRAVYQLNADGSSQITQTQAYAGNNGRNAILDNTNNQYLTVGNAGNGNGDGTIPVDNGVQSIKPGQNPATAGTTPVGNYNITQQGYKADKQTKDNNFRGETIFNNTLYVTKGSGGNGIDTVYQVGLNGALPTGTNNPISILPGFSTTLAKVNANSPSTNFHPFGLFFANATTLYVADEGDGTMSDAGTAKDPNAGLEKWSFNVATNTWVQDYTLQTGLNLGSAYAVNGYTFTTETDGLRNLTGKVNADGSVTLYAVTSTVSTSGDQGADPNKLVAINDLLSNTSSTFASAESFTTLDAAGYGEVLRGVSFAPAAVPEASTLLSFGGLLALGGLIAVRRKRVSAAK